MPRAVWSMGSAAFAVLAAVIAFVQFQQSIGAYFSYYHGVPLFDAGALVPNGASLALALFIAWTFAFAWRLSVKGGLALMFFATLLLLTLQYYLLFFAPSPVAQGFTDVPVRRFLTQRILPLLPQVALVLSLVGTIGSFAVCITPPLRKLAG